MAKPTEQQIADAKQLLTDAGIFTGTLYDVFDVIEAGAEMEPPVKVTQKQAKEIFAIMKKNHDMNIGINWDFLKQCIQWYFEGK